MTTARLVITGALTILLLQISQVNSAQGPVNLGSSANYVIFASSGITAEGSTTIRGNVGLRSSTSNSISGFGLSLSSDRTYSTSNIVSGKIYASGHAVPTPSALVTAASDIEAAYNDAISRSDPDFSDHASGSVNGIALSPGLYKWTTSLTVSGTVTISGTSTDIFIFQIDGGLTFNDNARIVLTGGVRGINIFWVSAGTVTVGSGCSTSGIILGKTNIVFNTLSRHFDGRALAQTCITMRCATISQPQPQCRPQLVQTTCGGISNLENSCNNCNNCNSNTCGSNTCNSNNCNCNSNPCGNYGNCQQGLGQPNTRTWVTTKVTKTHNLILLKKKGRFSTGISKAGGGKVYP